MDARRPVPKASGLAQSRWQVLPWIQDHCGTSLTHTHAEKGPDTLAQTPLALCTVLGSALCHMPPFSQWMLSFEPAAPTD